MIPSIRLRGNYRDQWEIDQRRQQAIRLRLRRIRGRYGNLHNHWRTVRHPFPKRNHQDTEFFNPYLTIGRYPYYMDYITHYKVGQHHLIVIKRTKLCIGTNEDIKILNVFPSTLKELINDLPKGKVTIEIEDQEQSMVQINTIDKKVDINYLNLP